MTQKCPNCNSEFQVDKESLEGEQLLCPVCKTQFMNDGSTVVNEYADEEGPPSPPPVTPDDAAESDKKKDANFSSGSSAGHTRIGGSRYVKLKPGDDILGYRLLEMLGAGAMAVVYKATQLSLNRTVALKILPERYADISTFVERFDQESQALAALNHPNIVTIIDRGRRERTYFFVMEYIDGPTLRQLMTKSIAPTALAKIIRQICSALSYAHKRGVVHRDIKPTNIMLNSSGEVKIADFGLAGLMSEGREETSERGAPTRMGTRGYMAPEQIEDPLHVDGRADIYALGVVMYQFMTGEMPGPPPIIPPSAMNDKADPRLDAIVERCLEPDRDKRYADADALLSDVEHYRQELASAPVCPKCGKESPVRFKACKYCGESLEKFFDVCLKCGVENRIDVRKCLECSTPLKETIAKANARINNQFDRVRELAQDNKFDEAMPIVDEILAMKGKAFSNARKRAKELKQKLLDRRKQVAREMYEEGQRLFENNEVAEAIEVWKQVPQDVVDVAETIQQAEAWLQQIESVDDVRSSRIMTKPKIETQPAAGGPPKLPSGPPALPTEKKEAKTGSRKRLLVLGGVLLLILIAVPLGLMLMDRGPDNGGLSHHERLVQTATGLLDGPFPGPLVVHDCYTFTGWKEVPKKGWGRWRPPDADPTARGEDWSATGTDAGGQRFYTLVTGRMVRTSSLVTVPNTGALAGGRLVLYSRYVSPSEHVALQAVGRKKGATYELHFGLNARSGGKEVVGKPLDTLKGVTEETVFRMEIVIIESQVVGLCDGKPVAIITNAEDALPESGQLSIRSVDTVSAWRDFSCSTLDVPATEVETEEKVVVIDRQENLLKLKNSGIVPISGPTGMDFTISTDFAVSAGEEGRLPQNWQIGLGKKGVKEGRIALVIRRGQNPTQASAYWLLEYRDDFGAVKRVETPQQERVRFGVTPDQPHHLLVTVRQGMARFSIDGKEQPLRQELPVAIMKLSGRVYLQSGDVLSEWKDTQVKTYIDFE